MNSYFSPAFFKANRKRLQSLFAGTAPIVVTAHGLLQRNSDTAFPFRQDSFFWYLTGINEPDVILVIDKGKEYLIAPQRDDAREAFDGSIDSSELSKRSGIETVLAHKDGWRKLGSRLKKVGHIATLSPPQPYVEVLGLFTNPARQSLINRLKTYNESIELLDLRQHITQMRVIKQEPELAAIRRAIEITSESLESLLKCGLSSYRTEYEVEAAITCHFRNNQSGHAYSPIIAAGKNACTLHYVNNASALQKNDLLLLDVGAEVEGYAADITRTYPVNKASRRQKQVLDAVIEVQDFAKTLIKPGALVKQYETEVEQFMGEKLRELGLIKTITHDAVREFYPHATSHFLGLDVHDVGDYETPLEPGMVLTVEPGIYIPDEGIGVRIEDDVLVTENGLAILTERLPLLAS